MKKIILFVLTFSILYGCSNSSSSTNNSQGTYFMKININGTEYYNEIVSTITQLNRPNCSNNGVLTLTRINQVMTSSFLAETGITHFSNVIDFEDTQKNILTNTIFKDNNSLWSGISNPNICERNNDFSVIIEQKPSNQRLYLKPNTSPTHTITSMSLISENASSKLYKIEGTFNAVYINGTNDFPVFGNYRVKIEIFK